MIDTSQLFSSPASAPDDAFTYDPRALLEDPVAALAPAVIIVGRSRSAAAAND